MPLETKPNDDDVLASRALVFPNVDGRGSGNLGASKDRGSNFCESRLSPRRIQAASDGIFKEVPSYRIGRQTLGFVEVAEQMLDRSSKHGWIGKRREREPEPHNGDSIVRPAAGVLHSAGNRTAPAAQWPYPAYASVYGVVTEAPTPRT